VLYSGVDPFPTYRGAQDECIVGAPGLASRVPRCVDYYNGQVSFICVDPPLDGLGDINWNGISYEVADAEMFADYFAQGLATFDSHSLESTTASDVNVDGTPLTVEDFVGEVRIMQGEALPYSLDTSLSPNYTAVFWHSSLKYVSFFTPDSLNAVWLTVEGEITPVLLADNMEMKFGYDTGLTNILIYSLEPGQFIPSPDWVLQIPGAESILRVSAATYAGRAVPTDIVDLSVKDRGDININGISFEIADAVMFANYFVDGLTAFGSHVQSSIKNSDVDADGVPLEVQDLAFMLRVIRGDTRSENLPSQIAPSEPVEFTLNDGSNIVTLQTTDSIGVIRMVFDGEVSPEPIKSGVGMSLNLRDGKTFILIWSFEPDLFFLSGPLLSVDGPTELLEVEAATTDARPVHSIISAPTEVENPNVGLPGEFALHGNYPNPFNPTTTIAYDLPEQANVQIAIYNVVGQKVRTLVDRAESAGQHQVEWDGQDDSGRPVSSGLYLYRMTAGEFMQSRKMLLLK
jgi:hypothetical protein